ncbi:MAG: 2-phosphosulfolactate phosphatase [Verrucomicrobiota bacterium]|nr:2-phosphosulfolactate phosphatase [Verrucomicrobiota bacterium]
MNIEAILTPAELPALAGRDLTRTACVVFDVLRATSTFVTALGNGARAVIPVSEISEALAIRQRQPDVLLGGERDGVKIRAARTGGGNFDFGNSPREYTAEKVRCKTIVSTTTNGTRAMRACAGAQTVLAASFLNLGATARFLRRQNRVLLVCAGTRENAALEDALAAGALCELLGGGDPPAFSDSAEMVRRAYAQAKSNLAEAVCGSENARRLLAIPDLRDDVPFCLRRDVYPFAVIRASDGAAYVAKPV